MSTPLTTQYIKTEVKYLLNHYYGIDLDTRQVSAFVDRHQELVDGIHQVGEIETCVRGWVVDLLGTDLGMKSHWPLGEDSDAYAAAYFSLFKEAALKASYRLDTERLLWKD